MTKSDGFVGIDSYFDADEKRRVKELNLREKDIHYRTSGFWRNQGEEGVIENAREVLHG